MHNYSLSHLSDGDLLRGLASAIAQDRSATAVVLAHIAEVDKRRLYLPAGFPSMSSTVFMSCTSRRTRRTSVPRRRARHDSSPPSSTPLPKAACTSGA